MKKLAAEKIGSTTNLSSKLKAELMDIGSKIEDYMIAASDLDISIYEEMDATSSIDELYKIYKDNIFENEEAAMEYFKLNLKYSMILKAKKLLDKAYTL